MSGGNTKRQIMTSGLRTDSHLLHPSYALILAEQAARWGSIGLPEMRVGIFGAEPLCDQWG
jgi:phenylacetate-coenzyme A ligase PaaK-like adenylate-forming protein